MASKSKFVGIDFDGSCVTHEYPEIGRNIGAQRVLEKVVASGHKLILITMRSVKELDAAQDWFKQYDIELYSMNHNPTQKAWTKSEKIYAHIYIDDANAGCPLIREEGKRPYIDWVKMEQILIDEGFINDTRNSTETLF